MIFRKKRLYLLLLPSLCGLLLFYVLPLIFSFYHAFLESSFTEKFVGLKNFADLLQSEFFLLAARNTLLFLAVSLTLTLTLSYALAYFITYHLKGSPLLRAVLFLPYLLPSAAITAAGELLETWMPPFVLLVLIFLWKYTGFCVALFAASFDRIDREVIEFARTDGADSRQIMMRIIFPQTMPMVFFVGMLTFSNCFKIHRESYLLWGSHPDKSVYMLQNYLENHFNKLNYAAVSAATDLILLFVLAVILILLQRERRASR